MKLREWLLSYGEFVCWSVCLFGVGAILFMVIYLPKSYPDTNPDTVTDAQASTAVVGWINHGMVWEALVNRIKLEEGRRPYAYQDSRGFSTIGYGTKLPLLDSDLHCFKPVRVEANLQNTVITSVQSECLLRSRLADHYIELLQRWNPLANQPLSTQYALVDMAYQLGVGGVLEFQVMLDALEKGDCPRAKAAALDSAWHRETPERAERVTALLCE